MVILSFPACQLTSCHVFLPRLVQGFPVGNEIVVVHSGVAVVRAVVVHSDVAVVRAVVEPLRGALAVAAVWLPHGFAVLPPVAVTVAVVVVWLSHVMAAPPFEVVV